MNAETLCAALQQAMPPLFVCSPAPEEGVRVRTPMLYPDGGVVDVFVLERNGRYIVTDFGDALGWLGLQSSSRQRSTKQNALIHDVCQTLRIQQFRDQLMLSDVAGDALGEAVVRVAQAAVRVADGAPERRFGLRHRDQMDVVRHQAVGPDRDPGGGAGLRHQRAVEAVVRRPEECRLAPVAPLCDVMRNARRDHAREPCHAASLAPAPARVHN